MSNYKPYTARERHRRAKTRQGMTARDFVRCMGITAVTAMAFFAAALV